MSSELRPKIEMSAGFGPEKPADGEVERVKGLEMDWERFSEGVDIYRQLIGPPDDLEYAGYLPRLYQGNIAVEGQSFDWPDKYVDFIY